MSVSKIFLTGILVICSRGDLPAQDVAGALENASADHPRLFFNSSTLPALKQKLAGEDVLGKSLERVLAIADNIIPEDPVERVLTGRRLLSVSRECLFRVSHLAFAYVMSDDVKYLNRARDEMLAAAGFSDWNPTHFLDVAEMTAALAIGYDWLYNGLDESSRTTIRNAIINMGLRASIPPGWWVNTTNNWNQVTNGGLTMGALAVFEDAPGLADTIITRAVQNVTVAMDEYKPHGAYPEGPGYWKYGTSYNVLLIDALESVLGTDFGLSSSQGFLESSLYFRHATGPTGLFYNYADNNPGAGVAPCLYWFARKLNSPSLISLQNTVLESQLGNENSADRIFPLLLVWAPPSSAAGNPGSLHYMGQGPTPVSMHRSSWSDEALYAGIKGGSPDYSHAHMDIGSFVLDWGGERWVEDLGPENYNKLETAGINLWSYSQTSTRWSIFRLNNFSHNTLVVNGELQQVTGNAPIVSSDTSGKSGKTIVDMSSVYAGQLATAVRGMGVKGDQMVVLQDSITAAGAQASVRWAAMTGAEVSLQSDTSVLLTLEGKNMGMYLLSPPGATFERYEAANPPGELDVANPGKTLVGFTVNLPANATANFMVVYTTGGLITPPGAGELDLFRPGLVALSIHPDGNIYTPGFQCGKTHGCEAVVEIHNIRGRKVAALARGQFTMGKKGIIFHTGTLSLPQGRYFARIKIAGKSFVHPIMVIR